MTRLGGDGGNRKGQGRLFCQNEMLDGNKLVVLFCQNGIHESHHEPTRFVECFGLQFGLCPFLLEINLTELVGLIT